MELSHAPPQRRWSAGAEYPVEVRAANSTNLSPDGLKLRYRVDGGAWSTVRMAPAGEGRFRAAIPGQGAGARVEYYITARDVFNNTNSLPRYGPYALYGYTVAGQPAAAFAWVLLAAVPAAALAVAWKFRREWLKARLGFLRRRPA